MAAVSGGASVPSVAVAHGRSVKAIQAQLAAMVPPGVDGNRVELARAVVSRLRRGERLDWRGGLRERRRVYWDQGQDQELRELWGSGTADLPRVAAWFGVDELDVHKRLCVLGLSDSYRVTVERLGCSAAGVVGARYNAEVGKEPTTAVILLVSGTLCRPGGPVSVLVSNHSSRESARRRVAVLRREHEDHLLDLPPGQAAVPVSWTIMPRPIDSEAYLGPDEGGTFAEDAWDR